MGGAMARSVSAVVLSGPLCCGDRTRCPHPFRAQPSSNGPFSRRPFFGGSARASRHSGGGNRDARHMDAVRIACTKPLLLRETVKEAVASSRVEKLQPKEL